MHKASEAMDSDVEEEAEEAGVIGDDGGLAAERGGVGERYFYIKGDCRCVRVFLV